MLGVRVGGEGCFYTLLLLRPPLHPWFGLFIEDGVGAFVVTVTPAPSCLFFKSAVHVHDRSEHTDSSWSWALGSS